MAATSETAKKSISAAHQRWASQSTAAKASGGSRTTLNAAGDLNNQPIPGYKGIPDDASPGSFVGTEEMRNPKPTPENVPPGSLIYNGQVTSPKPPQVAAKPSPAPAVDNQTVQKAFQNTISSGIPAPQTQGAAAGLVQGAISEASPAPAPQVAPEVENFFQASPIVQPSLQELSEFLSPTSMRKELEQTMKTMMAHQKEASGLKLELANVERIMDGTEQDIRDEVEAVGGMATESQILGLTVGRNKTLLKRASMIQDQLNYVKDAINMDMTMYGFQKDMAQQEFQNRSFLLQYKQQNDQFIYKATQDAINRNISALGYDGLFNATGGDPYKIARLEQVMGLQQGGLQQAATQAAQAKEEARRQQEFDNSIKSRQLALEGGRLALSREQFNYQKEQDALANQPIPGMPTGIDGKPLNQAQTTALGFGARTLQAGKVIDKLGQVYAKNLKVPNISIFGKNLTPNFLKSSAQQQYEQAQRNFVNAVLRRESGAAISPSEFENASEQYFPKYGDSDYTIIQKQQNRTTAIQNLLREGGQGNIDPTKLTLSPDGQLVFITD